jgi:hypothetical protein
VLGAGERGVYRTAMARATTVLATATDGHVASHTCACVSPSLLSKDKRGRGAAAAAAAWACLVVGREARLRQHLHCRRALQPPPHAAALRGLHATARTPQLCPSVLPAGSMQ